MKTGRAGFSPRDAAATIRRLYRDTEGYSLDRDDRARITATRSSPTYGELMPAATSKLIEHLDLGPADTFYDLGSGVGKVVMQVAMSRPVARCVGIELASRRHQLAQRVLTRARAQGHIVASHVGFRCSDFMRARIRDATVVYTCSTAFSNRFMRDLAARLARLRPGLRWVTTRDTEAAPWFRLEGTLSLDMSWRRKSRVFIYRLHQPRT